MAKPSQQTLRPEATAPEPARRVAPRTSPAMTADRRLRNLERLTTGLTVAHVAREERLTVTRIRQILVDMLESREIDPPAGFVQIQIARLSEAMIVARTMTRRAMCGDGSIDQADARTRPLSRLRQAAGCASRTLAAPAPGRAATTPVAGAEFGADGSRDENFPGYKALKFHEMEKKSVDWSSPPVQGTR